MVAPWARQKSVAAVHQGLEAVVLPVPTVQHSFHSAQGLVLEPVVVVFAYPLRCGYATIQVHLEVETTTDRISCRTDIIIGGNWAGRFKCL